MYLCFTLLKIPTRLLLLFRELGCIFRQIPDVHKGKLRDWYRRVYFQNKFLADRLESVLTMVYVVQSY
jgi:hypothetical protein